MDNKYNEVGLSDCNCNAGFSGGIILDPFFGYKGKVKNLLKLERKIYESKVKKLKIINYL